MQLRDVAESVDYGVTASATEQRVGPKFLRITDIQDGAVSWDSVPWCECNGSSASEARLRVGDIVFARTGATTGKSFLIRNCPTDAVFASYLIRVRLGDAADPRFVSHYFQTADYWAQIAKGARGVAQPGVNATTLKALRIPLPPVAEQRRIAEILDRADALRAKRHKSLAELDRLTQSIFLEMFGDPVTNPKGWPQHDLKSFFRFRTGKLDSNAAVPNGVFPFFTCSRDDLRIDNYAFDCEALLLAGNNASGDYSVKHYNGKFNAYQRTYVITLLNESNSYDYARVALAHRLVELKRLSKGTNTKYLTLELLNGIRIPVPPPELQRRFAQKIATVTKLIHTNRASLAEFETLFASVQHRAFCGEI
jgi:type I restriction enzyme S subunit